MWLHIREYLILTEFHNHCVKIVDFLIKAYVLWKSKLGCPGLYINQLKISSLSHVNFWINIYQNLTYQPLETQNILLKVTFFWITLINKHLEKALRVSETMYKQHFLSKDFETRLGLRMMKTSQCNLVMAWKFVKLSDKKEDLGQSLVLTRILRKGLNLDLGHWVLKWKIGYKSFYLKK